MNQVYKQFQLYLMLQNCTLGWARTDCENVRTKAIGNIIDVIECFEERTSFATEAVDSASIRNPLLVRKFITVSLFNQKKSLFIYFQFLKCEKITFLISN